MTHTWILDVLADLKAYARKNDLGALAEQLDDARLVAVSELARRCGSAGLADTDGRGAGQAKDAGGTRGAL